MGNALHIAFALIFAVGVALPSAEAGRKAPPPPAPPAPYFCVSNAVGTSSTSHEEAIGANCPGNSMASMYSYQGSTVCPANQIAIKCDPFSIDIDGPLNSNKAQATLVTSVGGTPVFSCRPTGVADALCAGPGCGPSGDPAAGCFKLSKFVNGVSKPLIEADLRRFASSGGSVSGMDAIASSKDPSYKPPTTTAAAGAPTGGAGVGAGGGAGSSGTGSGLLDPYAAAPSTSGAAAKATGPAFQSNAPGAKDEPQGDAKLGSVSREAGYEEEKGEEGECQESSLIGGKYSCRRTKNLVEASQVVNQLTQTTGSIAVGVQGAAAQQNAFSAGTQSAALEGAATTQKFGAGVQGLAGATNVVMGVMQLRAGSRHSKNQNELSVAKRTALKSEYQTGDVSAQEGTAAQTIIEAKNFNKKYVLSTGKGVPGSAEDIQYRNDLALKQKMMGNDVKRVSQAAAREQTMMKGVAQQGATISMITGAQQLGSAAMGYMAAKQMEAAAKKLKEAENAYGDAVLPPGVDSFPEGDDASGATTITGDGSNPEQSQALADSGLNTGVGFDELGEGFDPRGGYSGPLAEGPPPGAFKQGGGAGAGGSAGPGGGVGATNTSAATGGSQDDPQPRLANQGAPVGFESGQGGGSMGGGNGGGGAGPDLSSLLAQFLPKKEDEDKAKGGILDFGGRSLASDQPISLLDRNTNIFQRIHETYHEKARIGRVGL